MTSCCRFLFTFKSLASHSLRVSPSPNRLVSSFLNAGLNFIHNHKIHCYPHHPERAYRFAKSGFNPCSIKCLASDMRRCSSSPFDPRANNKKPERTCPHGEDHLKERVDHRANNKKPERTCPHGEDHLKERVDHRANNKNPERTCPHGEDNLEERVDKKDKNVVNEHINGAVQHKEEEEETVGAEVGVLRMKEGAEFDIESEAWKLLRNSVVTYCNSPVGTVAANDPNDNLPLNYDQVFIRDFVPSALAFLLKGEGEIVKNFLLHTLQLQSWEKTVDCYSPGQGLMPASFKASVMPVDGNSGKFEEVLDPDFGECAIGRVAPVDSGLWWIILLRAYGKLTGDLTLQERLDVQTGVKLILNLCLTDGFDMFPSLLVTDGSCMIDRRMGIHGHPLEIQALFYSALRSSREILSGNEGSKNVINAINGRLSALSFHIREYYWVDMKKINEIYRYKTEEYSMNATNKFNIYPDQIPYWLMSWIPAKGGYMIGNLQPAHMDFRFFTLGNLWSVISSMGTPKQNEAVLNLIEAKWDDLMADMPMKICYPAIKGEEWRIVTGSDPKNTPWSYHNGGSWPTLLWQFTLACLKMGRSDLAEKAVSMAEKKLQADSWPEYYDTRHAKFIGKQSRLYQTWTIAGFLTSKMLLENPEKASLLHWGEDYELLEICVCALTKNSRKKCCRGAAKSHILVQATTCAGSGGGSDET